MKYLLIALLSISASVCAQNDMPRFTLSAESEEWNKYFLTGMVHLTDALSFAESHSIEPVVNTLNAYRSKFAKDQTNLSANGWALYENISEITCECDPQVASTIELHILSMAQDFDKAEKALKKQ
jgi:hypothetical protein